MGGVEARGRRGGGAELSERWVGGGRGGAERNGTEGAPARRTGRRRGYTSGALEAEVLFRGLDWSRAGISHGRARAREAKGERSRGRRRTGSGHVDVKC